MTHPDVLTTRCQPHGICKHPYNWMPLSIFFHHIRNAISLALSLPNAGGEKAPVNTYSILLNLSSLPNYFQISISNLIQGKQCSLNLFLLIKRENIILFYLLKLEDESCTHYVIFFFPSRKRNNLDEFQCLKCWEVLASPAHNNSKVNSVA